MELEHTFRVQAPIDEAFAALVDVETIVPCMPGATLLSMTGDNEFTGEVVVKLGPMRMSYRGDAKIVSIDRDNYRAVLEARGRETRGTGTAAATVTASLHPDGDGTVAKVVTDLAVTGRPAQFGRGIMIEVGDRLLAEFARRLSERMAEARTSAAPAETPASTGAPEPAPTAGELHSVNDENVSVRVSAQPRSVTTGTAPADRDGINLVALVIGPVMKRVALFLGGAAVGALITWLVMR